jgi:ADP-ribose pyrophosphatase YjhB (NUDIX family)
MRINISKNQQFILRSAGIFFRDNSVLLHRAEGDDIWALPGGACEFHEDTREALIRESLEELNASIKVKSLGFTVENFFDWNGQKAHEIGFYYYAEFKGDSARFYEMDEFVGIEEKMEGVARHRLYFKWVPLPMLSEVKIKPEFLKEKLIDSEQAPLHVINRDR